MISQICAQFHFSFKNKDFIKKKVDYHSECDTVSMLLILVGAKARKALLRGVSSLVKTSNERITMKERRPSTPTRVCKYELV